MPHIITGTCKVYIFDSIDRCRMIDMILKKGVTPVAFGRGDRSPYLLFMTDEVVPLINEWRLRKDSEYKSEEYKLDEQEHLREF